MSTNRKAASKSTRSSKKSSPGKATTAIAPNAAVDVRALRQGLGLTRKVFSRLSHFSERAIADWEGGEKLSGPSRQRMMELTRLQRALTTVIEPSYVGEWLQTPNDAFEGLKPLEVIERGQIDRLWRMIYILESGVPA